MNQLNNNGGTHTECNTQQMNYRIVNGYFVYYCLHCKKEVSRTDIIKMEVK